GRAAQERGADALTLHPDGVPAVVPDVGERVLTVVVRGGAAHRDPVAVVGDPDQADIETGAGRALDRDRSGDRRPDGLSELHRGEGEVFTQRNGHVLVGVVEVVLVVGPDLHAPAA